MEKYISFSCGNLRFIDSCQFVNNSLHNLVHNLAAEGEQAFHHLKQHFPDSQQLALLIRKRVYPYDHVYSPEKLSETTLPSKEAFYNKLRDETVSDEDYAHAQKVWKTFNMATMADYHDLYMVSNTLLLADTFERFRNICLGYYKLELDPAHYYTSPGLAWDAMLKMTGVELALLTDIDMYLMVERGIWGGISMISNKYAKANNMYLPDFNPDEPNKYIMYLYANNLYGWAMSQYLPHKEFDWL